MTPWFVVNPNAGRVRHGEIVAAIRRQLGAREATIASELPAATADRPRLIVAVGGDGTVNAVINHCDPRCLRLALIPLGSANDLGAELAIPASVEGAWNVIDAGRFEEIDLIAVNGSRFATCGGIGLITDVARRANAWKTVAGWRGRFARSSGTLVYLAATLVEVWRTAPRPIHVTLCANGVTRPAVLATAIISNQARFGGRFSASPLASNRDGDLHLCGMEASRSRARLLWLCFQIFRGTPGRCREFFQFRARSLTIETAEEVAFSGDGEVLARGRHFRIEVLPRALTVATVRRDPVGVGVGRAD